MPNEKEFAYGLSALQHPVLEFDLLGLADDAHLETIKNYDEAEQGRAVMLATRSFDKFGLISILIGDSSFCLDEHDIFSYQSFIQQADWPEFLYLERHKTNQEFVKLENPANSHDDQEDQAIRDYFSRCGRCDASFQKRLGENGMPEYTNMSLGSNVLALSQIAIGGDPKSLVDEIIASGSTNDIADMVVLSIASRNCRGGKGEMKLAHDMFLRF